MKVKIGRERERERENYFSEKNKTKNIQLYARSLACLNVRLRSFSFYPQYSKGNVWMLLPQEDDWIEFCAWQILFNASSFSFSLFFYFLFFFLHFVIVFVTDFVVVFFEEKFKFISIYIHVCVYVFTQQKHKQITKKKKHNNKKKRNQKYSTDVDLLSVDAHFMLKCTSICKRGREREQKRVLLLSLCSFVYSIFWSIKIQEF